MRFKGKILIAGAALLAAFPATQASAAIWCAGKVTTAYIDVSGFLMVDWGYSPIMLCNLNIDTTFPSPQGAIGYKTCQGVYSAVLTAQSTTKDFMVLLPNDSSCSGLFNGGNVATKYILAFRIGQ
jgi:hypothetical protein